MANKTLGTRQKLSFRIAPSQGIAKPRNPVAVAAKQRRTGVHGKSVSALRQQERIALGKRLHEPDPD